MNLGGVQAILCHGGFLFYCLIFIYFFMRLYYYQSKEDEQIAPGSREDIAIQINYSHLKIHT